MESTIRYWYCACRTIVVSWYTFASHHHVPYRIMNERKRKMWTRKAVRKEERGEEIKKRRLQRYAAGQVMWSLRGDHSIVKLNTTCKTILLPLYYMA